MLNVYTSQYKYDKENKLDITVKTGLRMFAPTYDMEKDHNSGKLIDEEYKKMYYECMRDSYKIYRDEWEWLLNQKTVVLVCFCKKDECCHRLYLADILVKLGAKYLGEI
jgi:uncharacterized protein YeaO (DUF488 family)